MNTASTSGYIQTLAGGLGPPSQGFYKTNADIAPVKTSGIQYELDSLRNSVSVLRDAITALETKLTPVSYPRPLTGNSNCVSTPKPTASTVSDIISNTRHDILDITEVVYGIRNGLDL